MDVLWFFPRSLTFLRLSCCEFGCLACSFSFLRPFFVLKLSQPRARSPCGATTVYLGVVEVGEAVGEADAEMEQHGGGAAGHARVAVGRARRDVLVQAEHAAQPRLGVERLDDAHLGRARVREHRHDARAPQRDDQLLRAVAAALRLRHDGLEVDREKEGIEGTLEFLATGCALVSPRHFHDEGMTRNNAETSGKRHN